MVLTIANNGGNIINVTERKDEIDMLPSKIFFDNFFHDFEPSNRKLHEMMKCDIFEEGNDYVIEVETPGFDKKDIKIELDDGYLRVSAEKSEDEKNSKKKYYRRERHSYTKCERQFYVGDVSDSDIKAEFRNGVLRLSVPKSEEKKEQKKLINID